VHRGAHAAAEGKKREGEEVIILKQPGETPEQYEERVKKIQEAVYGKRPSLVELVKEKAKDGDGSQR